MDTVGDTTPFQWEIKGPGNFTVTSNNGEINGSTSNYSFSNDISRGNITNGIRREQNLIKSEQVNLDSSFVVKGTHQSSYGGAWIDYGTPELHTGQSQKGAESTNMDLYALLVQYPNRDDGEPIYNPLPNVAENLKKAEKKVTGNQKPMELPQITSLQTFGEWLAAVGTNFMSAFTVNRQAQVAIAAQMTVDDLEKQKKEQKEYLVSKFGEEVYNLQFKSQVEAGAVFFKEELPYNVTKEDIYRAGISDGKAENRAAWLKRVG